MKYYELWDYTIWIMGFYGIIWDYNCLYWNYMGLINQAAGSVEGFAEDD